MSQLWQDMRYAFRTLRSAPGFAAVAILTLAVGIGANAAIFSFVNGILLNPLPYPTADRIVRVLEKPPGPPTARNGISTLNYLDWEKQNHVFEYMAPQTGATPFSPVPAIRFNCAAHGLAFITSTFSA